MVLRLILVGEGQSLDLHIPDGLRPLAEELRVYEAIWNHQLFIEDTITTREGHRSVWTVVDDQLTLIELAIARIEANDFSTPEPEAVFLGTSQLFLGALSQISSFCSNQDQLIFDVASTSYPDRINIRYLGC